MQVVYVSCGVLETMTIQYFIIMANKVHQLILHIMHGVDGICGICGIWVTDII